MACWEAEIETPCPINTALDEATVMPDGSDDQTLARDMVEVYGPLLSRGRNAYAVALAGQALQANY
jgi:hypothetical protein